MSELIQGVSKNVDIQEVKVLQKKHKRSEAKQCFNNSYKYILQTKIINEHNREKAVQVSKCLKNIF